GCGRQERNAVDAYHRNEHQRRSGRAMTLRTTRARPGQDMRKQRMDIYKRAISTAAMIAALSSPLAGFGQASDAVLASVRQGNLRLAVREAQAAVDARPQDALARQVLGILQAATGRLPQAEESF